MKKSLIALAALAATGAFAQSSVTLYGGLDIGWGTATTKSADGTSVDKTTGLVDGTQGANRIGFRGTEDLGGGLTAGFQLEQGISPVSSNGWNLRLGGSAHQVPNGGAFIAGTMRAGNVSLRSNALGLLEVGTMQWSAGYAVANKAVVLAENFGGEAHALVMPARITGVSYTSPAFSGMTVTLQHGGAHGARTDRSSAADASDGFRKNKEARTGINVQYTAGPLYLGAAYESTAVQRTANSTATTLVKGPTLADTTTVPTATNAYGGIVANGTAVAARTEKAYALGAQYDLGMAKLYMTYANRDNGAAGADNRDSSTLNYSVTVPLGNIILAATVTDYDVKSPTTKTTDLSGSMFGARYNLSKRTNLYLYTGSDKDKAIANDKQSKRSRTVVGVAHVF
jgi:predicted porin